jgi:hypothetical protein
MHMTCLNNRLKTIQSQRLSIQHLDPQDWNVGKRSLLFLYISISPPFFSPVKKKEKRKSSWKQWSLLQWNRVQSPQYATTNVNLWGQEHMTMWSNLNIFVLYYSWYSPKFQSYIFIGWRYMLTTIHNFFRIFLCIFESLYFFKEKIQ